MTPSPVEDFRHLVKGQMYRIVFRPPSGLGRDLEIVAKCLDVDDTQVYLNQRPQGGTTSIDKKSIIAIFETDSKKVVLPHRISSETRVL